MKPHDHAIFLPPLSCNLFIPRLIFAALFCPCRHGGNTDGGLLIGGKIQLLYNVGVFSFCSAFLLRLTVETEPRARIELVSIVCWPSVPVEELLLWGIQPFGRLRTK